MRQRAKESASDAKVEKLSTALPADKFYYKGDTRFVNLSSDQIRTQLHHHRAADNARLVFNYDPNQHRAQAWR